MVDEGFMRRSLFFRQREQAVFERFDRALVVRGAAFAWALQGEVPQGLFRRILTIRS